MPSSTRHEARRSSGNARACDFYLALYVRSTYSLLMNSETNFLYVNSTGVDIGVWHKEIAESLKATGSLPEEIADLFTVRVGCTNADGSPRYVIEAA